MSTRSADVVNGLTTSWVPLTTPGPTLSPECSSAIYLSPQDPNSIGAYDPWYGQNVNTSMQCNVPEQTVWWDQDSLARSTLFNLGPLACPNGYTTATTTYVSDTSTILACCPSGYTYQRVIAPAPDANECFSSLTKGQVITPMSSQSLGSWVPTTLTITGTGSVIHGVQINGWNFGGSTSTSSGATASLPTTMRSSTSSLSTNTAAPNSSNSGLSGGAKAGIGIGAALVAVAVIAIVAFLMMRRRRTALKGGKRGLMLSPDYYTQDQMAQHNYAPGQAAEYPGEAKVGAQRNSYVQQLRPVEMSAESRQAPVEIG